MCGVPWNTPGQCGNRCVGRVALRSSSLLCRNHRWPRRKSHAANETIKGGSTVKGRAYNGQAIEVRPDGRLKRLPFLEISLKSPRRVKAEMLAQLSMKDGVLGVGDLDRFRQRHFDVASLHEIDWKRTYEMQPSVPSRVGSINDGIPVRFTIENMVVIDFFPVRLCHPIKRSYGLRSAQASQDEDVLMEPKQKNEGALDNTPGAIYIEASENCEDIVGNVATTKEGGRDDLGDREPFQEVEGLEQEKHVLGGVVAVQELEKIKDRDGLQDGVTETEQSEVGQQAENAIVSVGAIHDSKETGMVVLESMAASEKVLEEDKDVDHLEAMEVIAKAELDKESEDSVTSVETTQRSNETVADFQESTEVNELLDEIDEEDVFEALKAIAMAELTMSVENIRQDSLETTSTTELAPDPAGDTENRMQPSSITVEDPESFIMPPDNTVASISRHLLTSETETSNNENGMDPTSVTTKHSNSHSIPQESSATATRITTDSPISDAEGGAIQGGDLDIEFSEYEDPFKDYIYNPNDNMDITTGIDTVVPLHLEPSSKNIHVLGTNVLGKFIAYSLAGGRNPPPVTMLVHRPLYMQTWHEEGQSIRVVKDNMLYSRSNINIESCAAFGRRQDPAQTFPGFGENLDHTIEQPDTVIENLIVTTDIKQTLAALSSIKHRLRYYSTICFFQPGLGIIEFINENLFTDATTRPEYMLGTFKHDLKSTSHHHWTVKHRKEGYLTLTAFSGSGGGRLRKDEWSQQQRYILRSFNDSAELSSIGLCSPTFILRRLEDVAINSVIGPLSVVFNCMAEALLYNGPADALMEELFKEISSILLALPELRTVRNLRHLFREERLQGMAVATLKKMGPNYTRMHQSLIQEEEEDKEIHYYNGYLLRRAKGLGIPCPSLQMVTAMAMSKVVMKRKERGAIPFGIGKIRKGPKW